MHQRLQHRVDNMNRTANRSFDRALFFSVVHFGTWYAQRRLRRATPQMLRDADAVRVVAVATVGVGSALALRHHHAASNGVSHEVT